MEQKKTRLQYCISVKAQVHSLSTSKAGRFFVNQIDVGGNISAI